MEIKVGDTLQIYFRNGNINNTILEVRAIVDNLYVVVKHPSGNYTLKDASYLELLHMQGILTIQ